MVAYNLIRIGSVTEIFVVLLITKLHQTKIVTTILLIAEKLGKETTKMNTKPNKKKEWKKNQSEKHR